MPFERLKRAAQEYCESKVWQVLDEDEMFAVSREADEPCYAVVGGAEVGNCLMLFEGAQQVAEYMKLRDLMDSEASQERLLCQIMELEALRFEPEQQFIRYRFAREQQNITDPDEAQTLADALLAAVQLAEMRKSGHWKVNTVRLSPEALSVPSLACAEIQEDEEQIRWVEVSMEEGLRVSYPALLLQNELALARLRKQPMTAARMMCAVRVLPLRVMEMKGYPIAMMLMDDQQGVVGVPVVNDLQTGMMQFAQEFLSYVEEFGRPSSLCVSDMRTYCLLTELAGQLNIPVQRVEEIEELEEAIEQFMAYMHDVVQQGDDGETADEEAARAAIQEEIAGRAAEKEAPQPSRPGKRAASRGKCLLCGREYAASGITRHLKNCLALYKAPGDTEYFNIEVKDRNDGNYWLRLGVKADIWLSELDQFLRDIWVECCGHMSAFTIGDEDYFSQEEPGLMDMDVPLHELVKEGDKFSYEYDFGSSTQLSLRVTDSYCGAGDDEDIELIAQNLQPEYLCVRCGKKAEAVMSRFCGEDPLEEHVYCMDCCREMVGGDDEELAEVCLPLFNSPRSGICAYGMDMEEEPFGE